MFKTECQKFSLVDRFYEILTIFQNVKNAPDQSNHINQLTSTLSKKPARKYFPENNMISVRPENAKAISIKIVTQD